jgi:hypothetical protein
MNKKIIIGLVLLVVVGIGAFFGIAAWRAQVVRHQEQRAFDKAWELIHGEQAAEAYAIVASVARPGSKLAWPEVEAPALRHLSENPQPHSGE